MKLRELLPPITKRNYIDSKLPYSIEVEAEFTGDYTNDDAKINRKFWHETNDGSLMNVGREFITINPSSIATLNTELHALFKTGMFQKYYIDSPRASTHVHVNVLDWTKNELLTVLTFYYMVESLIMKVYCDKNRHGNLFCLPLHLADAGSQAAQYIVSNEFDSLIRTFDVHKYAALNIVNVGKIGTIEFRQFEGTDSAPAIVNWLNVIDKICSARKVFDSPQQVWNTYINDRVGLFNMFFPKLGLSPVEIFDEMDHNYSTIHDIITYEPKKYKKKKTYVFPTELSLDNME